MSPNSVDLEFDCENSGVEGEKEDAIKDQNPGGQEAELAQTTLYSGSGTSNKNNNFNTVVLDELVSTVFNGILNSGLNGQWGTISPCLLVLTGLSSLIK